MTELVSATMTELVYEYETTSHLHNAVRAQELWTELKQRVLDDTYAAWYVAEQIEYWNRHPELRPTWA